MGIGNVSRIKAARWIQGLLLAAAVLCLAAIGSPAKANLVQNGSFELTTLSSPGGYICQAGSTCTSNLSDWTSSCNNSSCGNGATVASLLFPNTSGSAFNGNIGLYGSVANSPDGGNFVAIDGDPNYGAPISQSITGLTAGDTYQLQFYQAAGQQHGESGATTEQWQVTLGSETELSTVMNTPSQSFTPWTLQTLDFVATNTTEALTFLAKGTPAGVPPVALLDGVSLTEVPEPATWALLGGGFLALLAMGKPRMDRAIPRS